MRVMIVVTHLLGTGHLARSLILAKSFAQKGDEVTLVTGGTVVDHFEKADVIIEQLSPVRSDGIEFQNLLTSDGLPVGADLLAGRREQLLITLAHFQPDILITELFPFGRRVLRDEFTALLSAAAAMQPRPLILGSIRDILAPPNKPKKITFVENIITKFYDGILFHADPEVVKLQESWPVSDVLAAKLYYTGFVAPKLKSYVECQDEQVLVSVGGGDVGEVVFLAACNAALLMPELHWRMFVGGTNEQFEKLVKIAPSNVTIEPPTLKFRQILMSAKASVSMVGYNTALDVLQAGVPAVLIPFDSGGEIEQSLRANVLKTLPAIEVIQQKSLNGANLVDKVKAVILAGRRHPRTKGMDGAETTVQITHYLRTKAI